MSAQTLSSLASAICSCSPGDADGVSAIRQHLAAALAGCTADDPGQAEALLSCLLETFTSAGEQGKAVLDDMVLELLPAIAGLAQQSHTCITLMTGFCNLITAACSPRDTITAFLELLDSVLDGSPGPDGFQFACDVLLLLPQQFAKLSRRKTANALECCSAAASLAKAHGRLLASWSLSQLALAAQQTAAGGSESAAASTLTRLDTFLAANWQAYIEFAQLMSQQVLSQESGAESLAAGQAGLSSLTVELLQHLTSIWLPTPLRMLSLQLLHEPSTAQRLPSADSVAPPSPVLPAASKSGQHAQQRHQHLASAGSSHAQAAVLDLLSVLQECGVTAWHQLPSSTDIKSAGAGLAALYSCICEQDGPALSMPDTVEDTVQLACRWSCDLVHASQSEVLSLVKAVALVQLAAGHARQLQPTAATTQSASLPDNEAAATAASKLVPALQPCVMLLAGVLGHTPAQALRSQASLALQQLLQALPAPVCFACLQQLLSTDRPHPEVAALLMQEVRAQLARGGQGRTCFNPASCMRLVTPWLLQHGPAGWQTEDALADRANAICAALAVVRLALLKAAAAARPDSDAAGPASAIDDLEPQQQQLKPALPVLSQAVADSLRALQVANKVEQGPDSSDTAGADDGRQRVCGEAEGSGHAVDAWLAVSRVQDVLDRVSELL